MIKNILFDFDGVILDSMPVREYGFKKIFEDFDANLVEELLKYHNKNGGLSRYVKIKYFYKELLGQDIKEEKILELAEQFSVIMKKELIKTKYIIKQTVDFINKNYKNYNFHIVSGSDEKELQYLCQELELSKYFVSIHGSPIPKNDLVKNLLKEYHYLENETILIGDSINDYEASKINNIDFYGFNNSELIQVSKTYIYNFNNLLFFDYGVGEISHSLENKIFYSINNPKETIDYLLFFDSRGLSINVNNYKETHLKKLITKLKKNKKSYVAISRPKNIMIFATLLNFLHLNSNLEFTNLMTNIGFVDFTPKKKKYIDDMKRQIKHLYSKDMLIHELSEYTLSDRTVEQLYALEYSDDYIEFIVEKIKNFKFQNVYFVNTPEITKDIKIKRTRHEYFFSKLFVTNKLIENIVFRDSNNQLIDIRDTFKKNELLYTYDAVHFTKIGHKEVFKEIDFFMESK